LSAIETERLTKRFRQLRGYRDLLMYSRRKESRLAVDDVTLQISGGELFGLLGENGAGKTSLIRMLSTTLIPTSGTARIDGHDVVRDPHEIRKVIGLVSGDERTFYWRLSGQQNLEFFASLYHVPRRIALERIRRLLETLGVTEHADDRFDSYSTGTRQKFAIARGLLTEPRILFLDEPTRALDPIAADEVRRYVVDHVVGQLGTTVLIATHTLAEAEAICDRIGILRHGKLFAAGTMEELTTRMALAKVFEIVAVGNREGLEEAVRRAPGLSDVSVVPDGERTIVRLHLGRGDHATNELLRAVLASGAIIEGSTTRLPNLDDIYRAAHAS
jgi:ABC-2 type transport system ATP-binding protein